MTKPTPIVERKLALFAETGRHVFIFAANICGCGSMHSWERVKDGLCICKDPACTKVHGG